MTAIFMTEIQELLKQGFYRMATRTRSMLNKGLNLGVQLTRIQCLLFQLIVFSTLLTHTPSATAQWEFLPEFFQPAGKSASLLPVIAALMAASFSTGPNKLSLKVNHPFVPAEAPSGYSSLEDEETARREAQYQASSGLISNDYGLWVRLEFPGAGDLGAGAPDQASCSLSEPEGDWLVPGTDDPTPYQLMSEIIAELAQISPHAPLPGEVIDGPEGLPEAAILTCPGTVHYKGHDFELAYQSKQDYICPLCMAEEVETEVYRIEGCTTFHTYCRQCAENPKFFTRNAEGQVSCPVCQLSGPLRKDCCFKCRLEQTMAYCPIKCGTIASIGTLLESHLQHCEGGRQKCDSCEKLVPAVGFQEHIIECVSRCHPQNTLVMSLRKLLLEQQARLFEVKQRWQKTPALPQTLPQAAAQPFRKTHLGNLELTYLPIDPIAAPALPDQIRCLESREAPNSIYLEIKLPVDAQGQVIVPVQQARFTFYLFSFELKVKFQGGGLFADIWITEVNLSGKYPSSTNAEGCRANCFSSKVGIALLSPTRGSQESAICPSLTFPSKSLDGNKGQHLALFRTRQIAQYTNDEGFFYIELTFSALQLTIKYQYN